MRIDTEGISPQAGQVAVWWLGQSGYALKFPTGQVALVDPYLSSNISKGYPPYIHARLVPPLIDPAAPGRVDAILLTHGHLDHCDNGTLVVLAETTSAHFYAPASVCKHLAHWDIPPERIHPLSRGQAAEAEAYRVTPVKAVHAGEDECGYIFEPHGGPVLYLSGDTHLFLGMKEIGTRWEIDYGFLCINGQAGNMGLEPAIFATRMLRPRIVIPNHYGMYADNTACPEQFAYLMAERGGHGTVRILEPGQLFLCGRE